MKRAIVTPFTNHLPFHPGAYLGYGTGVLEQHGDVEVYDFNASMYSKNREALGGLLGELKSKPFGMDDTYLNAVSLKLEESVESVYAGVAWDEYDTVYITTPSWLVVLPTENVLKLARAVRDAAPKTRIFFFSNSVGTYTDRSLLEENDVKVVHLNALVSASPAAADGPRPPRPGDPVDFDRLPDPVYPGLDDYLFDLLPFRLKHGCPWGKCRFCSLSRGANAGYLERSAEKAADEVGGLVQRYDPELLVCRDNAVNGKNLLVFCDRMAELNKPWVAAARADLSEAELAALRRSRCKILYFGLESGSDRVLAEINKGVTAEEQSVFTKRAFDEGMLPVPSLFVGSPTETEEDFIQTCRFLKNHEPYLEYVNIYPLLVGPASDFQKEGRQAHPEALMRIQRVILACVEAGLTVCVGPQTMEYVLFERAYPKADNYSGTA